MKVVTKENVEKALASLESQLDGSETVVKASDDDLDQPEGADLGNPAKEKMSDAAKSKGAPPPFAKKDDEEEEDEEPEMKSKACKSFAEEMPEEIQTKIDVSDFLKSLVGHTGEVIDGLRETVAKSDATHGAQYETLAKSLEEVQQSQAKIGVVLKAICQRIGVIESAPAHAPKAETVAKSDAPARTFTDGMSAAEAAPKEEKVFKGLSDNPRLAKSQISEKLCDLVKKGEAQDLDVIGFETNNYIRPELVSKLQASFN